MKKLLALFVMSAIPAILAAQALNCNIATVTNPNCNASCNGSATATASGGVPPYSFIWQPGNIVGQTISNMCAGSYTCTITDQASTVCSATVNLVQPPALLLTTSSLATTTCSSCDGTASVSVTGGVPPYSYCWGQCICPTSWCNTFCAGTYTVYVTDANGCADSAVAVVQPTATLTVSAFPANPSICEGSSIAYVPSVTGGTGPYVYSWTFPGGSPLTSTSQNPIVQYNVAGSYTTSVTATDANGCTGSGTIPVTVFGFPTVTTSEIPATCNGTGTVSANATSAQPPYVYNWMPGNINTAVYAGATPNTTYTCTVTDANGCTTAAPQLHTDSCDYVWPGDANDDAIADNVDILDIGIANGATGTTRANASLTWIGQPSAPWGQTLASGTDYKWVDCDGNGAINSTDTQAVVLNYGQTHNNRLQPPALNGGAPAVMISFDQDSVESGTTGTISLSLGDAANPATNVYGLAFRLNFDAAQMNTSSFGMTGGTTWFGTPGTDMMRVVLHPSPANGYVDVAITRYDQQNVSGFGMIGQMYYTATNTLNGTGNSVVVPMNITNVVLVDNAGTSQPVNVVSDSVVVADTAVITGTMDYQTNSINVYPNPANDNMQIVVPGSEQQLMTIEDMTGRIVYSGMLNGGANTISVSNLPAGAYLLRIGEGSDMYVEQIAIAR